MPHPKLTITKERRMFYSYIGEVTMKKTIILTASLALLFGFLTNVIGQQQRVADEQGARERQQNEDLMRRTHGPFAGTPLAYPNNPHPTSTFVSARRNFSDNSMTMTMTIGRNNTIFVRTPANSRVHTINCLWSSDVVYEVHKWRNDLGDNIEYVTIIGRQSAIDTLQISAVHAIKKPKGVLPDRVPIRLKANDNVFYDHNGRFFRPPPPPPTPQQQRMQVQRQRETQVQQQRIQQQWERQRQQQRQQQSPWTW